MMKNNGSPQDLRKRAVKSLASEPERPDVMCLEEANSLIHELRVHQIQLEMQNEELLRVQHDLEVSRLRYSNLYDFAPVGYLTLNKQGQILELNLTAAKQLGVERGYLIKTNFQNFIFQPDKRVFLSHLKAVFDKRERQITEVRLSPKGGEQFYARIESTYMEGESGTGLCMTNMSDVTLRKQAEEALRESQQMSSLVLDTIPVRVFWKDFDLNYLGCNRAFALDAGFQSPKEIEGRNDSEMPWGEQAQLYRSDDRLVIETGRPKLSYEEPQTAPSGDKIWLRTSKVPLIDVKGEIRGVLGTYEDITVHKRTSDELIKAKKVIQALSDCNNAVIHIKDEVELLRVICRIVVDVGGYRMAWVGYAEEDRNQTVTPVAKYGHEQDYLKTVNVTWKDAERGKGPAGTCIRTGFPSIIHSVVSQAECAPWKVEASKRGYASIIGLPLFLNGGRFGALTIYSSETDAFDTEEVEFLVKLSSNLSYGIEALRLGKARMQAEESLKKANLDLERRVEERTAKLTKANAELRREVKERRQAEDALEESKQQLTNIIDFLPDATFVINNEGEVIAWNKAIEKMTGIKASDMLGKDNYEYALPFYGERRPILIDLVLKPQEEIESKYTSTTRRANEIAGEAYMPALRTGETYLYGIASILRDSTGNSVGAVESIRDITERKQMEEVRRDNQSRLDLAVRSAHMGVWQIDFIKKKRHFDDQVCHLLGIDPAKFTGTEEEFYQAVHPDDREMLKTALARTIEQDVPYETDYRAVWPDGSVHYIATRGKLVHDDKGQPVRVNGLIGDITERKKHDQQLHESEANYRRLSQEFQTLLDTVPDGLLLIGPNYDIIWANRNLATTLSATTSEIIDRKCFELFNGGAGAPCPACGIRECLASGLMNTREVHCTGAKIVELRTSPVKNEVGEVLNFIEVSRDITELRKTEEQLRQAQKMESVGQLAGGVAHDFNNMLGIILGYAEIALDEAGPETPLHEQLTGIRNAARRSADITQQLLAFARKQTINPRAIDLNETIECMLKMLRRIIGEDIGLTWLPETNLHPVRMDPMQIDQILANLVVNARDAITYGGKVTIATGNVVCDAAYCAAHDNFVPGEYVTFSVGDNGCGMDKQTQRHIFEPFFTTKVFGKGTGLGLATVYGIVKQNDGFINVNTELGQGTTFEIYIPRHAAGIAEAMAPSAVELPQNHGETVLLVEDEPELLKMGKTMLKKLGYNVFSAGTPAEAIRLVEEHTGKINLLLTDVVMPEMNGQNLTERLLAINPGMECLFMSGYTADVIAQHGVLKEKVQFIQKPFSIEDLSAKVREALDG